MERYNGYTSSQRARKLRELHRQFPDRSHPYYTGPCDVCGDTNVSVSPHSEDYSEPFKWFRPAVYALCRTCHGRIHKRFNSPHSWDAYKWHLRRGGTASDLKQRTIASELSRISKAFADGTSTLDRLGVPAKPDAWWEQLATEVLR